MDPTNDVILRRSASRRVLRAKQWLDRWLERQALGAAFHRRMHAVMNGADVRRYY
jgi:hypothetical protein